MATQSLNSATGIHLAYLGRAYENLGQSVQALKYYTLALHINRQTGDRRTELGTLGNMGILQTTRKKQQFIEYYEQSISLSR